MTDKANDDQMSDIATDLVKRVLIYADEYSFKEGMSDDMNAVLVTIVNNLISGVITKYQAIFESLNEKQISQFKSPFYEAIGVGYKIYWSERKYLKNEDEFVKFKGPKFQEYLLKEYEDYCVNQTRDKNPDSIIPSYIKEAANYFGIVLFKGAYVGGDKIELLKRVSELEDGIKFLEEIDIAGLLKAMILTGYLLSLSQDEYRELAGVPTVKKYKNTGLVQ